MAGKKDYKKTKQYKALKKELEDDLESRGLISEPYKDKVDEYMRLWCWLQMLNDDISVRGVFIEYQNGENQKGSQMLSIWAALGFKDQAVKAKAAAGGEDDEL